MHFFRATYLHECMETIDHWQVWHFFFFLNKIPVHRIKYLSIGRFWIALLRFIRSLLKCTHKCGICHRSRGKLKWNASFSVSFDLFKVVFPLAIICILQTYDLHSWPTVVVRKSVYQFDISWEMIIDKENHKLYPYRRYLFLLVRRGVKCTICLSFLHCWFI